MPKSAADWKMGLEFQAAIWYVHFMLELLMRKHPQIRVYFGGWTSGLAMICKEGKSSHISRVEHTKLSRTMALLFFSVRETLPCHGANVCLHSMGA